MFPGNTRLTQPGELEKDMLYLEFIVAPDTLIALLAYIPDVIHTKPH